MKCQKLLITALCGLALSMTVKPMMLHACAPSSQQDTGESSNASSDSKGSKNSDTLGSQDKSNIGSATSERNSGNSPSNFQLIDCSDPFWSDFIPCFEQMVKSREAFVSQPKGE
jgi:hypothetical protein